MKKQYKPKEENEKKLKAFLVSLKKLDNGRFNDKRTK